jgi:glycosyltransferase involved in cell wall biosynthesis
VPDRLRVVLVVAEVAGGIAVHVRSVAIELSGLDVDVMVIGPASSLRAMRLGDGPIATVAAPVGRATPGAWWAVRRQLRRHTRKGSVVHAHGLRAAAVPGVGHGVTLVVTWHNAPLGAGVRQRLHAGLERYVARRAAVVLAASADLAGRARDARAPDVRVGFVAAPTPAAPTRSREQVRESLGVEPELPLVLAVARLHPQKRLDVLLAAAAGWPHSGAGARRVVVAGDGPGRKALDAEITRADAPVTLLGARDDVADLMAAADVVVLTSEWEARSLVAQEALRAGVPLVCTNVGGLPELVGDAALLVPVSDPDGVRAAVDRILADTDLRATLIERGQRRAAGWPTPTQTAAALRDLYLDLRSR